MPYLKLHSFKDKLRKSLLNSIFIFTLTFKIPERYMHKHIGHIK